MKVKVALLLLSLAAGAAARAGVDFPLGRTAYFTGETVPLVVPGSGTVTLAAVNDDGPVRLWSGPPGVVLLDTARLAPGRYALQLNGTPAGVSLYLASPLRRSAASLQDECLPSPAPQLSADERKDPVLAAAKTREHQDRLEQSLRETGLTACFSMGAHEMAHQPVLDVLARQGVLVFANPDTRPTSFFPVALDPLELDGMSQRMLLTAQANGRYPNFGGFCYGWDVTGFADDGRNGLLTYWSWGDKAEALRAYCAEITRLRHAEFTRRTGLQPVSQAEYIGYLLGVGRADLAPVLDLPSKRWMDEIVKHMKPLRGPPRAELEQRLDAWSQFLMGLYGETFTRYNEALHAFDPTLRHSASIQVDHCPTRVGQYFPSAYAPLDFQYQSTWNDQVGGPDYSYQWLFTAGLLEMGRGDKPVWISNAPGATHGRAAVPGKFLRVAAHDLAYGGSGLGFALEAFSNLLGGMNGDSQWEKIRGTGAGADVLAGREFLDRFAALALQGRADHGVGVLFSRSQLARQHLTQGFGTPQFKAFIALARLGYTPRFVTEEELPTTDLKALVIAAQTVPFPEPVLARLGAFAAAGGKILTDASTTLAIPGAQPIKPALLASTPGTPYNWAVPNMVRGENDSTLYDRWHPELAAALHDALGDTGRGILTGELGAATRTTLLQISGGADATYIVAVNDSHVATQADWVQLRERLRPTRALPGATLYDCTAEKCLGPLAPFACDLSETTARVFGVLPRELKQIALAARADADLAVSVEFLDGQGQRLAAVLPFHLALLRPDGKLHAEFWRATTAAGTFAMTLPLPANVPAGEWQVRVRSQLTGDEGTLPVKVAPAPAPAFATAWNEPVWARETAAMEQLFARGAKFVLPVFDSRLLPAAERVKATLARRGVAVEIRPQPELTTWWLAYALTPQQAAENARAERGETIGRIKRLTANGNDWFCGLSGYRFDRPVILLDRPGATTNELAAALDAKGLLWPHVDETFPGPGRAVVQPVHWAFGPRVPAIVLQARDETGLLAGAAALAKLPPDRLTPGIRAARAALFREQHIGGAPAQPAVAKLTARATATRPAPQPFALRFVDARPPKPDEAQPPQFAEKFVAVPDLVESEEFVFQMRVNDRYVEARSPGGHYRQDLRFCDAILVPVEVTQPGRTHLAADGLFRYSDRRPCSAPQWEELLQLYHQLVHPKRAPITFDAELDGHPLGQLVPTRTEQRDVPLETLPHYATEKPKSAPEEAVLELAADLDLPAGRHRLLLIPRNIVDGQLQRLRVGVTAEVADSVAAQRAAERKAHKQ